MTAWLVFGVLILWRATNQAIATRRASRRPTFVSWARPAGSPPSTPPPVRDDVVAWTSLDDHQLERLLSESSSP